MLRLSFIVPFYNVEPYIEECIRSLYNQDIPQEEYEVICIDDCSPDGSRAIVERLQQEYPTLKLLRTPENLRQGGARNMGLDVVLGRYVWFVDSDDYIEKNCVGEMLDKAESENLDILRIFHVVEGEVCEDKVDYGPCSGVDYIFNAPLKANAVNRCCNVVNGLIRTQMLREHNIRFAEKVQYEDDDYAIQMYAYATRVHSLKTAPYIVRLSVDSTTRSSIQLRKVSDWMAQVKRLVVLERQLKKMDKRWAVLIKDNVSWTCKGMVPAALNQLTRDEVRAFYRNSTGRISGLRKIIGRRSYLALNCFMYWKLFVSN